MKFLISLFLLMISLQALASKKCTISFMNEVSENTADHRLYKLIQAHKSILKSRGYILVSESNGYPTYYAGDISRFRNEYQLGLSDETGSHLWRARTRKTNRDIAVQILLSQMAYCKRKLKIRR